MKTPITHKTVLSTNTTEGHKGNYDVVVGSQKEDELPVYLVINRDHGVVEFFNENLFFIKDWLNHFVYPEESAKAAAQEAFENIIPLTGKKN